MYCGRCGQQLSEDSKFCPKCGWKVDRSDNDTEGSERTGKEIKADTNTDGDTEQKTGKKKKKKWPWIAAFVILIAAAGITAFFLLREKQVKEQYDGAVADADRYLEDLDYENAEASYLKAISIDPKNEEPYLKLADLYLADHQPQKALEIVQQGQDSVSSTEAKEELSGIAEEWKDLEQYSWAVEPGIEADEIYYLQSQDFFDASENERCRQMDSEYAVIRQGDRYGLIDMEGNLLEGMDYTSVDTILGYYEVTTAEPRYTSEYLTEMSIFYLAPSGELEPAVAMFGDVFGSQGEYYYCDGLRNTVDNIADTGVVSRNWELNELTVSIPVKQTEQTYEDALESGTQNTFNGLVWIDENLSAYAIWDEDELKTEFIYDECGSESSGLLTVQQNGKWGYVNPEGEVIIPVEYDASWQHYTDEDKSYCYAATEGYIPLVKDGVWEMRDTEGRLVIAPGVFEEILPVYGGKCWVKADGKWGVIRLDAAGGDSQTDMEDAADSDENTSEEAEATPEIAEQESTQNQQISYSELYGPLLDQVRSEYQYSEYLLYMLYDIDKDGVKELLLETGTCEADYMYEVYTVQNGSAVYLGEIPGGYSEFYADENGGTENYIIRHYFRVSMEGETITYVYLENGALWEEEIISREVPMGEEYYSNPYPLESAYISDKSLLEQ